jgi:small subunit ribosomal protein S17
MSETTANTPTQPAAPAPAAPVTQTAAATRSNRKERIGEVISANMAKTIVVRVERRYPHPKFKKVVTGYKKFYAHDEKREAKVGDRVRIEETRPLSRTKRWRLVAVVAKGTEITPVAA